jgi:hypothetical protein
MKCKRIRNHMEEYLDGAITGTKKNEFERHIKDCADCKKFLLERQRLGEMLSGSLKKISSNQEPSPELLKSASTIAEKVTFKPRRPLIPSLRPKIAWPKLAAVGLLPLIALVLGIVFLQKNHDKNYVSDFHEPGKVSYLKLTTTHFAGTSSDNWIIKRVHVQTRNGENGFLTLELTKEM